MRRQRRSLLLLLLRLPRIGWAEFKRELFIRADLRADELLFDPQVRDRVTKAQASGRAVWLATASGQELAETVAGALEIPSERAIGTTTINLKGARKAAASRYGGRVAADRGAACDARGGSSFAA